MSLTFISILIIIVMLGYEVISFQRSVLFRQKLPVQRALSSLVDSDEINSSTRLAKHKELISASKLSLAPMMEYTDRHFRHLVRLVSNRTLLYTEMVAANAIAHERCSMEEEFRTSNPQALNNELRRGYTDTYLRRYLSQGRVSPLEGPSVLQIGGSDPEQMFIAAQTVCDMAERNICDYTAINLNCGCPSPKVAGKGCFGAALMDDPKLVSELTKAIHDGCEGKLPVTVKCRIGTDVDIPFTHLGYRDMDEEIEYAKLCRFIETVASNGIVTDFQVHARIAVLSKSFSPADNRKIPPLKYDLVRKLVKDYPEFTFTLNGGIKTLVECQQEFEATPGLKGIMIGRAWAANPWSFAMADRLVYETDPSSMMCNNRLEILQEFGKHADAEEEAGDPVKIRRFIIKAITPLFAGEFNGKKYRIALDEIAGLPKKLQSQGKTLKGYPPLSELILNAAYDNLQEEILLRSREESYEMMTSQSGDKKGSNIVEQWQQNRKASGSLQYEKMLQTGVDVHTT
mmetsp:Transcript_20034/g.29706  ORF Transcript_20034/g.29706 Transcript_20034/m.29706 type:complete len:514 (-) Transcript_20034:34-1575(-)